MFDLKEHSHTRLNILTEDWIVVTPHSIKPPWQGKYNRISVLYQYDILNSPIHFTQRKRKEKAAQRIHKTN